MTPQKKAAALVAKWRSRAAHLEKNGINDDGMIARLQSCADELEAAFADPVTPVPEPRVDEHGNELCDAVSPYHFNERCDGGRVTAPNAQFTRTCPTCKGTGIKVKKEGA